MRLSLIIPVFFLLFSCEKKISTANILEINREVGKTVPTTDAVWLDTVSGAKYLKIYSQSKEDWKNLIADFGVKNIHHQANLQKLNIRSIPYNGKVQWITEKSFAIVEGCGTDCRYVLIFNDEKDVPIIQPLVYFPNMRYGNFKSDNPNLYIAINEKNPNESLIIVDTDSQKKDTIYLPLIKNKGIKTFYDVIDSIQISNGEIEVFSNEKLLKREIMFNN